MDLHPTRTRTSSWRLISLLLALNGHSVHAAFTYTAPAQCEDLTVSWYGGTAPYSLLLAPHLEPARNLSIPSSAYNGTYGSYTFQLPLASQLTFLLALSDAAGVGSLGTTDELTVNTTSTSCNTDPPTAAFNILYNASYLEECADFRFTGFGGASKPITIHGLIPEGTAFDIDVPTSSSSSYTWNANVALGTTLLFVPVDSKGNFAASSDFLGVGSGTTSSCLNSTSPGTTTSQPSGPTSSSGSHSGTGTQTSTSSTSTSTGGAGGGHKTNVGTAVGIAVGVTLGVIAGFVIWFLWYRRRRNRQDAANASGFNDGAFIGGKGRNRNHIDLLPAGGAAAGAARGEDDDNAARYPLNARQQGGGDTADYEPVPYVLPPGEGDNDRSEYDPYGPRSSSGSRPLSGEMSTVAGASTAAASKSAMAALDRGNTAFAPNAPARFLVHEDAGSVEGGDDEEGEYSEGEGEEEIVDLPPQYNSLGVMVVPQRSVSRRRSTRRPVSSGSPVPGAAPAVPALPTHAEGAGGAGEESTVGVDATTATPEHPPAATQPHS